MFAGDCPSNPSGNKRCDDRQPFEVLATTGAAEEFPAEQLSATVMSTGISTTLLIRLRSKKSSVNVICSATAHPNIRIAPALGGMLAIVRMRHPWLQSCRDYINTLF